MGNRRLLNSNRDGEREGGQSAFLRASSGLCLSTEFCGSKRRERRGSIKDIHLA